MSLSFVNIHIFIDKVHFLHNIYMYYLNYLFFFHRDKSSFLLCLLLLNMFLKNLQKTTLIVKMYFDPIQNMCMFKLSFFNVFLKKRVMLRFVYFSTFSTAQANFWRQFPQRKTCLFAIKCS